MSEAEKTADQNPMREVCIAEILAKYPTARALAEKVLELEIELETQDTLNDIEENEELLNVAQETLGRVREQILKGDSEYAVELIGREIGY